MTQSFLENIGLPALEQYIAEIGDRDIAVRSYYEEVLRRTEDKLDELIESFVEVFQDSTALTLAANLIKWASFAIPGMRETLAARAEARQELGE